MQNLEGNVTGALRVPRKLRFSFWSIYVRLRFATSEPASMIPSCSDAFIKCWHARFEDKCWPFLNFLATTYYTHNANIHPFN